MKRLYILSILLFLLTFLSLTSVAQTLSTSGVPTKLCANESFTIGFDFGGAVSGGNEYIAELSDEVGSFISPIELGREATTALSGTIYCTIPNGVTFGTGYQIRVLATASIVGQINNPSNIIDISCTTRDYYWLGGAGNWSDLSHWEWTTDDITYTAATELPLSTDNVIFDDTTFPSGGQLTVDVEAFCNDFYWDPISGANNPVIWSDSNPLNIYGDFEMANGVYRDIRYLYFQSVKHYVYLDFADNLMQFNTNDTWYRTQIYFYGNGSFELNSDLVMYRFENYSGTFYTNDFTIDADYRIYNGNTFYAGNSTMYARNFSLYGVYFTENSNLFIRPYNNSSGLNLYGGQTHNNVTIDGDLCYIGSDNTFNNLSLINGGGINLSGGSIQTINSSFNAQGVGRSQMAVIKSDSPGLSASIFDAGGATITADYVNITDNIIDNGFANTYNATNAINGGNNTGWIFSELTPLDFYWVGGTGNWSEAASHWATTDGGSTMHPEGPSAIDDVYFTSNSFPAGGTVTIDQATSIKNMTWAAGSGNNNPEIYGEYGNRLTLFGDLTMDTGVQRSVSELFFDSSLRTINLSLADNLGNHGNLTFTGGGIINLLSEVKNVSGWFNIENVTLNSNDNDVTFWGMQIYSDFAIVNWGNSNLYMDYYLSKNNLAAVDYGTSTLYIERPNAEWESEIYGTHNFNNVEISNVARFHDASFFNSLTAQEGGTISIAAAVTQTVTGSLNMNGSRSSFANISAFNGGNGLLETTGATVTADFVSITDNTINPAQATPISGVVATPDNNIGWNIVALPPLDFYWIGGTGNWTDPAHWATTDGGTTLHGFAPGSIDNAIFTSNSFSTIGQVTIDQPVTVTNVTWEAGSGTNHPEIFGDWGNRLTILGDFTLDNGVSRRVYELIFDSSNGPNTINMADNYNQPNGDIRFRGGGVANLASDLHSEWGLQIENATLNTNGFTLDFNGIDFNDQNPVLNLGSSDVYLRYYFNDWSNTPTFDAGTSTIYFTPPNNDQAEIRGNNPRVFNNVVVSGILEIQSNNSYNNLTVNPGSNLKLFAGSVQTINNGGTLNLVGSRSGLIYLESFDNGTPGPGFFDVTGATVTADYISITDNTIDNSLAANVLATNAIDNGGNTGWDYTPIASLDYYWIGGAGNWSDYTNHWQTSADGGTTLVAATGPPGTVDNVFFTGPSNPNGASFPDGGTLTLDVEGNCNNMTWETGSGANFPVIYSDYPIELVIHGSLQMAEGVTRNVFRINFDSDTPGNTISMADNLYNWGDIDFNGTGEWTLQDSLSTAYLNIRGGTLNTNNQPIYVQQQIYLDWQHTGVINWGSSNVYLRTLNNDAQNLTFNSQTSTFNFDGQGSTAYLQGGYTINFYNVTFSGRAEISNSFQYTDLTLLGGTELELQAGSTQTVASKFTAVGSRGAMIQISSSNPGAPATLLVNTPGGGGGTATLDVQYTVFQDNDLDNGDADPLTEELAASSVDNGGNSGWDFLSSPLAPLDFYWVGGTGNWSDTTHWVTTDGGTTNQVTPPGVIDNVFFTSNSFPASGTITLDQPATCNNMTWNDGSFKPTIRGDWENRLTIRGNLTIANGVNRFLEYIDFNSSGDNLISLGDNRYEYSEFSFRGGGTWSLLDSLAGNSINIYSGTLNTLNSPITLTWDFNIRDEGPITLNLGSSQIQAANVNNWAWSGNVTTDVGTAHITILDEGRFGGDSMGFYDVTFKGNGYIYTTLDISNNLTILPGGTLELEPNQTITIGNLIAVGTRPLPVTIKSTQDGQQGTLSCPATGVVTASDIVIKDNNAIGGAVFNATESIDKGNNTGWNFSPITPIDFYWIGGSGNWSDFTNHWQTSPDNGSTFAPASFAPGAVDDVFVDAILTSAPAMTIDIPAECNNMTWSAGLTGSSITGDYESPFTLHGSLVLSSGVSLDLEQLNFNSDISGNNIDLAGNGGNQYINMLFNGTGDWTMLDSLSVYSLELSGGILNTNGFPLNAENLSLYGGGPGVINLGSSDVYLGSATIYSTNLSVNSGTSTVFLSDNATLYNSWTLNNVEIDGDVYVHDKSSFNTLTLKPGSILYLGDTLTVQQTNAVGLRSRPITIKSTSSGTSAGLVQTSGVVLGDYLTIQDNDASGGALFVAQNSIDNGNVTGWTINATSPRNYYWVGGTGKWSEFASHWSNTDGGSNFYDSSPGPLDNVFFTSNSFPSGGTLTLDFKISVKDMDWTGSTSAVSITDLGDWENNNLTLGGSLTLANGVSRDFDDLYLISNNTGNTINMADNLSSRNYIYIQGNGEWSLTGPLDTYYLRMEGGTFNSNNQDVTSTYLYLQYDNISYWGSSNVTTRRFYTNYLNNSSTFNSETSIFNFIEAGSIIRGNNRFFTTNISADTYIYNSNIIINANVTGGRVELSDNQAFSNLTMTGGSSLSIGDGTTQTVNIALTLNGTEAEPVVINSTTDGLAGNFTVPATGTVTATYVHLKDNTANSGGAAFNTSFSSDFGNVNGWNGLLSGQTIYFNPLTDQALTSGSFNVNASTDSPLAVSYEIAQGSATLSGSTVTPSATGLIGVRAIQAGDATYGNAVPSIRYIHIDATTEPNELGNMKEAKLALGQFSPESNDEYYDEFTVPEPWQVAISSTGKMAVANGSRVLIWNQIPDNYGVAADVVVGQPDFTTDRSNLVSASTFSDDNVYSVAFSKDDKLLVSDRHRILIWNTIPTTNGAAADVVIGQDNFTSTKIGTGANRFGGDLLGITIYNDTGAGAEKLIISDFDNSRVLVFNSIPTTNGASADIVIGQADFNTKTTGNGADELNSPVFTSVTSNGSLLIAEYGNNRITVFNTIPTVNGTSANSVLGQSGFGISESGLGPNSYSSPTAVSVSRTGKLAIADYGNNRVLIYNSLPADNTTPPDYVLGQPDFDSNEANYNSISGRSLFRPINVDWDVSENLFVSDNANSRVLIYGAADIDAPVASNANYPTTFVSGQGVTGGVTLTDRSGIALAELRYRGLSTDPSIPSSTIPLIDNGNGTWSLPGEVHPDANNEKLGMEYSILVRDGLGNDLLSGSIYGNIQYNNGLPITNFGVGNTTESYRMFSVPLDLASPDAKNVFDEIMTGGTYDNSKFRLFSFPGGSGTSYTEYGAGLTNIDLGKGYFALASASATVNSGQGTTYAGDLNPFTITLVSGWNMIGNPYNFNVLWADVLTASGITAAEAQPPQGYNGSFAEQTIIASGEGVFVNNPTSGNVTISVPLTYNSAAGRIAEVQDNTNSLANDSWEIRFLHQDTEGYDVVLGGVGMEKNSIQSFDEHDRINPPPFGEQPKVEFNHPEFFQPSFKKDIRTRSDNEQWSFTYTAEASEDLDEIYWDNSYFGYSSPDIYLVDKTHFEVINMKEVDNYQFEHGGITKFEVYYGMNALEALLPNQLEVQSPYPNPFTEQVKINVGLPKADNEYKVIVAIYNTMGKQVATLTNGALDGGYYSFKWLGTNDSGNEVPNGIYAYRVMVKGDLSEVVSGKLMKE